MPRVFHRVSCFVHSALLMGMLIHLGTACSWGEAVDGWTNWRGPLQNGVSSETGLPDSWAPDGENHIWTYDLAGRGSAVISGDRLFTVGYKGHGADLQEFLTCLNADTGEFLWEHGYNDFLSDIVYDRYSIGAPTVDRETGNVYFMTAAGIVAAFTPDGKEVWSHSMMEGFGRLTFPNGRTGSPVIDDDLVIVHAITSFWGADGPARDRFYAFDKLTGELVWSSTPGDTPKDSSFSTPVFETIDGKRVLYAGTGCGHLVCLNARTGDPIWRFQVSRIGVNASPILYKDRVVTLHDGENVDSSENGRMVAIKTGASPKPGEAGPVVVGTTGELWRNGLSTFSSSAVQVENKLYQMTLTGELACVDLDDGKVLWQEKLGPDQLHASPLYADGKLYIPLADGSFHIIRPTETKAEVLSKVQLAGSCLGSPTVWDGKIYVHTTEKLYCFGNKDGGQNLAKYPEPQAVKAGEPARLQIVPSEVLVHPGDKQSFRIRALDKNGNFVSEIDSAVWTKFIPPTARVKSEMDASFNEEGVLIAAPEAKESAGAFQAVAGNLKGIIRGRLLSDLPINEDFEGYSLTVDSEVEKGVKFAYPPLPWIGARFKWEVRDLEGQKVLAKTLDTMLFQRAITFLGHPDMKNYTFEADVMTDGNRRTMSNVGVINQRYVVALIGNWQQLEVSSNHDRVKVAVPFKIKPKSWYRLKTRVDLAEDGTGTVRAKAWPREEAEPEAWTIEVPHATAHPEGAPGIFGFSLQNQFRVYVDNLLITPNE